MAIKGYKINIPKVTGDIVISCVAIESVEAEVEYNIVNNLTNCTTNNTMTTISKGAMYSSTITVNNGYTLGSIVVEMGGEDISSSVVVGNNINIPNVTGNIVITVTATKEEVEVPPEDAVAGMTYGKGINQTTGEITDNPQCWATVYPISVTQGKTYTISLDATYIWVVSCNDNGDVIIPFLTTGTNSKPQSFTFTANTSKIRYGCYDPNKQLTYCNLTEGGTVVDPTPTPDPTPDPEPPTQPDTPSPGTGGDLTGTYLFFGDSICYGGGSNGYGYPQAVKTKQPSMTSLNYGISGTCIAKNTSYDVKYPSILSKIQKTAIYADYIILEGGVNDSWGNRNPIGTFKGGTAPTSGSAIASYANTLNEYQFADALEKCICEIKLKWWEKPIFFLIPHRINEAYSSPYFALAIQICNKWGVKVIDLRNCGIPTYADGTYNVDGTHPTKAGYDTYYAQPIINVLKANK